MKCGYWALYLQFNFNGIGIRFNFIEYFDLETKHKHPLFNQNTSIHKPTLLRFPYNVIRIGFFVWSLGVFIRFAYFCQQ